MNNRQAFALCSLLLLPPAAGGEALETAADTERGFWEQSRRLVGQAWEDTRRLLGGEQDDFKRVWEGLLPKLEQTLALEDRTRALPERAWWTPRCTLS